RVKWLEFRLPHEHGAASRQECRGEEERIAEGTQSAPGYGVPGDDDQSASQDQRQPRLLRGRQLFSEDDRGDQSDEQRHATRIERALVASRRKVKPARRRQRIRRAEPGNDYGQSKPSQAVASKA